MRKRTPHRKTLTGFGWEVVESRNPIVSACSRARRPANDRSQALPACITTHTPRGMAGRLHCRSLLGLTSRSLLGLTSRSLLGLSSHRNRSTPLGAGVLSAGASGRAIGRRALQNVAFAIGLSFSRIDFGCRQPMLVEKERLNGRFPVPG